MTALATLTPATLPDNPAELLGALCRHDEHGLGALSFSSTDTPNAYAVVELTFRFVTLTVGYWSIKNGLVVMTGERLELSVGPMTLRGHDQISGLSVCEFAVRERLDALRVELRRAA